MEGSCYDLIGGTIHVSDLMDPGGTEEFLVG
jgi:hypothetical protein